MIDRRLKIQLLNESMEFFELANSELEKKCIVAAVQESELERSKREVERKVNGANETEFGKGKGKKQDFDERGKEEAPRSNTVEGERSIGNCS